MPFLPPEGKCSRPVEPTRVLAALDQQHRQQAVAEQQGVGAVETKAAERMLVEKNEGRGGCHVGQTRYRACAWVGWGRLVCARGEPMVGLGVVIVILQLPPQPRL